MREANILQHSLHQYCPELHLKRLNSLMLASKALIEDCWLDCGRTNAYSAAIVCLTPEVVQGARIIGEQECALLSAAQINLLCMQNAHFDHC